MIKKIKILGTVFIPVLLMFRIGCAPDAPHENPLDPFRQSLNGGQFTFRGQVLQKNPPHNPVSGCLVFLQPEQKYTQTNQQGRFEFTVLQKGGHQTVISKPGFDSTLIAINFDTLTSASVPFYLNGKPFLKNAAIYSEYIDQWWPDPQVFLLMSISVGDPDGVSDLRELRLEIPGLELGFPFSATAKPDSFYLRLDELQFPENTLFPLIGQETEIVLVDASGSKFTDATHRLLRIIDTSPLTKSPTGLQTVAAMPAFVWQPYLTTFSFSYELSVFVVSAGIPVLIHRKKLLDVTQTQYVYPDSLSSGAYFWTIGIRDKFGNFSRSKEASFLVQ